MEPQADGETGQRSGQRSSPRSGMAQILRSAAGRLIVWLHRQADQLDLVPAEFGDADSVDPNDGGAVVREWLRQARLWAAYNPEGMLALKAGGVALALVLLGLIVLVGAIK